MLNRSEKNVVALVTQDTPRNPVVSRCADKQQRNMDHLVLFFFISKYKLYFLSLLMDLLVVSFEI